jgi:hypothetical protein
VQFLKLNLQSEFAFIARSMKSGMKGCADHLVVCQYLSLNSTRRRASYIKLISGSLRMILASRSSCDHVPRSCGSEISPESGRMLRYWLSHCTRVHIFRSPDRYHCLTWIWRTLCVSFLSLSSRANNPRLRRSDPGLITIPIVLSMMSCAIAFQVLQTNVACNISLSEFEAAF